MKSLFVLLLSSFIFHGVLLAQDATFSQFYSNPLYLNPALAGSVDMPRLTVNYRNQWPSFNGAYTTYSIGYDMPVDKLKGGIGILFVNDSQSNKILNSYQAEFIYSAFIKLNEDFRFYGGIEAGLRQNSLKWDNLVFPDNLDASFGHHTISSETPISNPTFNYFDVSSGILLFSKNFFAGLAVHHINEPNQSYYKDAGSQGVLYRKYTLHAGSKIRVFKHGHLRKKFDLSPQVILQQQGDFTQFNYGLFANRKGFSAGVWLRQNFTMKYDALIFLVGFIKSQWQVTFSYDWTISGLAGNTGGTSEISFGWLLKSSEKKKAFPFYRTPGDY